MSKSSDTPAPHKQDNGQDRSHKAMEVGLRPSKPRHSDEVQLSDADYERYAHAANAKPDLDRDFGKPPRDPDEAEG